MKSYTLGIYEKALPNSLDLPEKLRYAREVGYDYLEMSVDATQEKIDRILWSDEERNHLCRAMEQGVRVGSICLSALTKYALGDPQHCERGLEIYYGTIQLASDLGIPLVMIPGYDIYFGTSTPDTLALYLKNLQEVVDSAATHGVVVGFETMENDFMNTTQKAMEFVSRFHSPYLQIYPDCGNITNGLKTGTVGDDLRTGKGHIMALHLKETLPNIYREVPYGTGHVDFPHVISSAWEVGVRRFVTEFWDSGNPHWKQEVQSAHDHMRVLIEGVISTGNSPKTKSVG